jgi:alpha-L-rhamnosidase
MLDAVPAELVSSVFCDSLEVYGADWTPNLPAEFARRRGYDVIPVLYQLTFEDPEAAQLRADYHRTLAELYEESFVAVCQRWAAGRGVLFRIQSYGTPPATISSYRFSDLFEGEGWGWKEITQTRWASSAAHLYRRTVVSAEVWTWVHSPSFRATPLDLKGEAHEHLLNGVNQLIGHGWPYSPTDAPGLGWFFYAAGALDDRNPWWAAMPELTRYLSRLCWLLQQGEPVADVALYVPNEDLFAIMGRAQSGSLDTWREAHKWIPGAIPATIRTAGLDYDLIDDDALAITSPDRYRVVVVPATTMIMDTTATWLGNMIAAGGSVIMIDSYADVPGAVVVEADGLAQALAAAVAPDLKISPPAADIGFVHRRSEDSDTYLVINMGPNPRTFGIAPRTSRRSYEEWHPLSGQLLREGAGSEEIELTLSPYEATVILLSEAEPSESQQHIWPPDSDKSVPLRGAWQVAYGNEPAQPVDLPHIWEDEPARQHYSGAATYATSIDLSAVDGRAWIDFGNCEVIDGGAAERGMVGPSYRVAVRGPLGEIAQVRVNDVDCGLVWAPPYQVEITDALRSGANKIELIVYNTAANALAADEHIKQLAAESEARYGRRFRMQDLERATESVRSGLLRVPMLVVSEGP